MNMLQNLAHKLDNYQRRHHVLAFCYAVVKKYGEDRAGSQAALLTYYGFLSLFPLLLVLTTLINALIGNHPHLEATILRGVTSYFPLLGSQLSTHVHSLHKSGLALVAGILFTLYGTRGVANAFRNSVQKIWQVPDAERDTFPKSLIKNFNIIIIGGLGFLFASISAAMASSAGHGLAFRGLSIAVNLFVLFWLFTYLLDISLPRQVSLKETWIGAAAAAIGLVVLQSLGSYLLARELKSLDALYSYFAIALALMFWIYLQAQMLCYAIEIAVVSSRKLWPRSFGDTPPTAVDKQLN